MKLRTTYLGVAILVVAMTVVGSGSMSQAALPSLPPGTTVTCSQISGAITLRPGIGATGTSTGVKWALKAVANNCTATPNSAGLAPPNIVAAIIKGNGFIVGGNTCAAAQVASNWGAGQMKVAWVSVPSFAASTFSLLPAGGLNAPTTLDATGISHDRNNVGPTPVQLQFGGDWTATSSAQYATDCSGPAPSTQTYIFQTPAGLSPHNPAFVAQI